MKNAYTVRILDEIVDGLIHSIFDKMKGIPKNEIVNGRYREKMRERKAQLDTFARAHEKASNELATLRAEVVKSIRGESAFDNVTLNELIQEANARCADLLRQYEQAKAAYEESYCGYIL